MLRQPVGVEVVFHNGQMEMADKMITQDYKIELIVQADVNNDPKKWLEMANKYNGFPFGEILHTNTSPTIVQVYSYSVEPIDDSQAEYKYINDMKKL